jgi:hypothetical protein
MKTKLIIGLAFLAINTVAGAQNNRVPPQQKNHTGACVNYVDANRNGICDNYENSASVPGTCKRSGCGKGSAAGHRQRGQGRRIKFVDADKNGICDNFEVPAKK